MGSAAATSPILAQLTEFLSNPDSKLRKSAVEALGAMGITDPSRTMMAQLLNCLCDADSHVRIEAVKALESFLRTGIRWFGGEPSSIRITAVTKLVQTTSP
jgi:HEAT repeat protein